VTETPTEAPQLASYDAPEPTERWHPDAHRVELVVEFGQLRAELTCPHDDGTDWTSYVWELRPSCRQPTYEDGEPDRKARVPECLLREYVDDERLEGGPRVTLGALPVEYHWASVETAQLRPQVDVSRVPEEVERVVRAAIVDWNTLSAGAKVHGDLSAFVAGRVTAAVQSIVGDAAR
jgi:hypothetical protein